MMSPAQIAASFAVLLVSLLMQASGDPAKPCSPDTCKLPDCFCSGTKIPGNLSVSSIPQIVMISFDAAVNTNGFSLYEELFDGQFKNPNECNISATFFVSHEYTNYCMVQALYNQRHEIADNSISRRLPISWWKTATERELIEEIVGMREILRKWGYVNPEDVKGFRAPYIQIGGNRVQNSERRGLSVRVFDAHSDVQGSSAMALHSRVSINSRLRDRAMPNW